VHVVRDSCTIIPFQEHRMKQHQQRQLDALRRVQDFLDSHADVVGALRESEGRKQLDAAATRLATLDNDQGTAGLELAGQASRAKALTADLRASHMQPIARFARARLRGTPDFAALTRSASRLQGKPLVRAARAMATAAAPHADALTRGGFPADTIAQLAAAADALGESLVERANTRVRRVGATKGIEADLLSGREAVAMLHAVIGKQFAGDATFLAEWRAARRVVGKPGAVRAIAGASASPASSRAPAVQGAA
jgi:hypothetical protein